MQRARSYGRAEDTGGFAALVELLTVYHLDEQGGYWRLEE